MKWIKIIPNDPLFFGTGKPFVAGSDTYSTYIFPPYPSTIYGALGTFLIYYRGDLESFIERKQKNQIKPIELIGPIIYKENEAYFPVPLDLVACKKEKEEIFQLNFVKKPSIFISDIDNIEYIHIFKGDGEVDEPKPFIEVYDLRNYLMGECFRGKVLPMLNIGEIYKEEMKIGIAIDRETMTSKERYLYRLPMIRMAQDTGFLIGIKIEEDFPESGIIKLGGEGKTARFEVLENNPLKDLENYEFEYNGIFKIYLATPAIFKNGWIPEWIDKETLTGNKEGIKVKLIGAVIGKYIRVGGWSLYKARSENSGSDPKSFHSGPKIAYKAVPAGSVYYFKVQNLEEVNINRIKEVFHFKNISDNLPDEEDVKFPQKGFGLSLVGGLKC